MGAGDRIVSVGNGADEELVDVVGLPMDDVADLIGGPQGSTVRLEILPSSASVGSAPKVVVLVRDKIRL